MDGECSKIRESVEGEEISVMKVMRAAGLVIISGSARSNDVVAVEQPVNILKAMPLDLRVVQEDASEHPLPQVRAEQQCECISDAGWGP